MEASAQARQLRARGLAGKTIFSFRGREDLRGQLAAMRKLAWRLGWLDRSIDPLDGLEIARHTVLHGASTQFVDPRLRPETRQVRAMADAADKLCGPEGSNPSLTRLPLLGAKIRVAGFGGLRLGELLQLPETASMQQVINAQDAERRRREELAARQPDRNLAWWNFPAPPIDELWLFIDTDTGLPVKPELHNERWHRIRAWVDANNPDNSWPRTIVYRNLRHHAATRWFHEELGEPWEVVAYYLGDKLTTVLNHYVRAGDDALRSTVGRLESF